MTNQDLAKAIDIAEEMSRVTSRFLSKNGGAANGYLTQITGCVSKNCTGSLTVDIPADLKKSQLSKISEALEEKCKKCIPVDFDPHFEFQFMSDHVEHGIYENRIEVRISIKIATWKT